MRYLSIILLLGCCAAIAAQHNHDHGESGSPHDDHRHHSHGGGTDDNCPAMDKNYEDEDDHHDDDDDAHGHGAHGSEEHDDADDHDDDDDDHDDDDGHGHGAHGSEEHDDDDHDDDDDDHDHDDDDDDHDDDDDDDHDGHGHETHGADGHANHGDDDDDDHDGHDDDHDADHDGHSDCPTSSYDFDGMWYYETMQKSPKLTDLSFAAYVKTDSRGAIVGAIFNIQVGGGGFAVFGGIETKRGFIRISFQGQTRRVLTNLKADTEYHLVITIDAMSNSGIVYVNGAKLRQVKFRPITGIAGDGRVTVGKMQKKWRLYQGSMRNVMIWNRTLTKLDVDEIYGHNHCIHQPVLDARPSNMVPHLDSVGTIGCPGDKYAFNNTGDRVEYFELGDSLPKLEFVTVCVKVTTSARGTIPGSIGGYATSQDGDFISTSGFIDSNNEAKNLFVVAGQKFVRDGQFLPNTKYSMCIHYHFKHKHMITYVNSAPVTMISFKGEAYLPTGGKGILGQRQTKLGRCFDLPYNGLMEDFMVWGRSLSMKELQGYTAGRCPRDFLLSTDRNKGIPHGKFYTYEKCPISLFFLTNTKTVTEYVNVKKTLGSSDYLTMCASITTDADGKIPGTIGSYSTDAIPQAIIIGGEAGKNGALLSITLNGETIRVPGTVAPNKEYSFCISIHVKHGHVLIYINGQFSREIDFKNFNMIPEGGKIIIGQAQGCPGGCFEKDKAYNGRIKNFMIWSRALSTEEMTSVAMGECPDDYVIDLHGEKRVRVPIG